MSSVAAWPSRAEHWLDERGKGAWIAAMILGFVFFWPVGLAILAYMIWSKRMSTCCSPRHGRHKRRHMHRGMNHAAFRSSGNSAFDAYKQQTLERLEEEQRNFEAFLERLRASKDKAEFDQFMEERAEAARRERMDARDEGDTRPPREGRARQSRHSRDIDDDSPYGDEDDAPHPFPSR